MAVVVVGGHSRNTGKTSVVAGLISHLREKNWTAVKITQFGHGLCSLKGRKCGCAVDEHPYAIFEEKDRSSCKDTSRFLAAGASRSLWMRTKQGRLELAMPDLRGTLESQPFVIIESNSILGFIRPDLYLIVLRFDIRDFKDSAREMVKHCDAAVIVDSGTRHPSWKEVYREMFPRIPAYHVAPPDFVSPELIAFVRSRTG